MLALLCALCGCTEQVPNWLFAVQSKNAKVTGDLLTLEGVGRSVVTYRQDRPGWTASITWASLAEGWQDVQGSLKGQSLEAVLSGELSDDAKVSVQLQILGPPTVDSAINEVVWPVKVLSVEHSEQKIVDERELLRSLGRGRLEPARGSWDIWIEAAAVRAKKRGKSE